MYFLAILFTLASAAANPTPKPPPKYMHNIEYFLRGYNVMKGNPHQTAVSAVDPGFQEPIFRLSYDKGTITPDDKYFSPDGTLVTMCSACSLSAVTKKISGMNSYRDSLSEKVKMSAGICSSWPWCPLYRFSWSVDYNKVKNEIYHQSNFYTHSDASCCAYQVQTDLFKPPPFSSDFLRGIITLPENCTTPENKALYRKFIDSFGTNYIKQTDMGSLFGQEIKISRESWRKMLNQSINIEWSASWSTFFETGYLDIATKYNQEKKQIEEFNNLTLSRSLYTKGSKPPKDGSLTNWVNGAKNYPAPISLELGSMLDLFTHLRVPQPIITNMNDTLINYCDGFTCSGLQPDQEFPRKWQPWLTTFVMGERSQPKFCENGDHVTRIQLARGPVGPVNWPWSEGLFDLCFTCSTNPSTWKCFYGTAPPLPTYWGTVLTCPLNGFRRMATYDAPYPTDPINVLAQCYNDNEPQYAFPYEFTGTWGSWVECDDGKKIVGFQVEYNSDTNFPNRIMNFRFECA